MLSSSATYPLKGCLESAAFSPFLVYTAGYRRPIGTFLYFSGMMKVALLLLLLLLLAMMMMMILLLLVVVMVVMMMIIMMMIFLSLFSIRVLATHLRNNSVICYRYCC